MAQSSIWWILAGSVVAVEMLTGTFYLLMFAIGLAAAAVAAHLGFSSAYQFVVAGVVGGIAVAAWHRYKVLRPQAATATKNSDVNLDIGQTVQVNQWNADGTGTVQYRGAQWRVAHSPTDKHEPALGAHQIIEVVGSQLVVKKI
jgi:membrane protein implicated in regulation of membrane protease activity